MDKRQDGSVVWECVCECGNLCERTSRNLVRGFSTHCGCSRKVPQNRYYKDLRNQRFNRLLVRYPTKNRSGNGSVMWNCICDCGTETEVSENDLIHGNRISCGCKVRENGKELVKYLHFVEGTCVEFLQRKKRSDNTSGCTGVYELKNGKYKAGITFKGKRYNLGTYNTFEEARAERLKAEAELHQSFLETFYAERGMDKKQDNEEKGEGYERSHVYMGTNLAGVV